MKSVARMSVSNFVTRVGMQAFAVTGAIVISRTLGTSGKGTFVYATTILALVLTATAGESSAIAWQYAQRHRSARTLIAVMLRIVGWGALPLCAALIAAATILKGQTALIAVAGAMPFAVFAQASTGFFLAESDVRSVNVQQILTVALPIAAYVPLLLFAHAPLTLVLALWACGYAVSAAYTAWRLRGYAAVGGESEPLQEVVREQLGYGAQVSLNSTVSYLNFRIDVFIILALLGQSALGVYSIGIGIGEMLWQLSRPLTTASFGRIARGERAEAVRATAACMRHSLLLVAVGAVIIFIAAPPLIPLVYGKAFAHAGEVTRVLLPGIVAYSMMSAPATFFAQQLGQPRIPLIFSSLSTAICAVLTILLLPHFGIIGGAIATSISYVCAFAAAGMYFVRKTGISPLRLFAFSRSDLLPYRSLFARHPRAARG